MSIINNLLIKYRSSLNDKDFGEILSGGILVFGAQIIITILGLTISVLVARIYSDKVLGVLVLVNSYFQVVTLLTIFGSSTSILRLIPEYKAKHSLSAAYTVYKKTSLLILIASIAIGLILFFGAGIISNLIFSQPDLKFIFSIAAVIVIFKSFQIFSLPVLRAINAIKSFVIIQIVNQLLFLLLIVIVPNYYRWDYQPIYLQYLTIIVIAITGLFIIKKRFANDIDKTSKIVKVETIDIVRLSFPMFLTSSMMVLMAQIPTLIIGIFNSEEEIAYYSVAFRFAALSLFVLSAINTVVAPKFAELYSKNKIDQLFIVARKSTKLIFYTITPVFLIFIFFGKWIIVSLYGINFEVSYTLLLILSIGMFISAISGSVGYFLNMTGHEKMVRNVSIITLILGIALNVILINLLGLIGVAVATTVMLSFRNIVLTIIVQKEYGKNFSVFSFIQG